MNIQSTLYSEERPVSDFVAIPEWIEQDLCTTQLAAILQGGCASGAYMPAVTYYDARKTMDRYGDDVLAFLQKYEYDYPEIFALGPNQSWDGIAVHFLSAAVEFWAWSVAETVVEAMETN